MAVKNTAVAGVGGAGAWASRPRKAARQSTKSRHCEYGRIRPLEHQCEEARRRRPLRRVRPALCARGGGRDGAGALAQAGRVSEEVAKECWLGSSEFLRTLPPRAFAVEEPLALVEEALAAGDEVRGRWSGEKSRGGITHACCCACCCDECSESDERARDTRACAGELRCATALSDDDEAAAGAALQVGEAVIGVSSGREAAARRSTAPGRTLPGEAFGLGRGWEVAERGPSKVAEGVDWSSEGVLEKQQSLICREGRELTSR
eukprot:64009-Pleurochrysis_carterae.AAC.1